MNLDRDFLARIAAETGFRGEMLEKVNLKRYYLFSQKKNSFFRC